jgi:hypothetical protein
MKNPCPDWPRQKGRPLLQITRPKRAGGMAHVVNTCLAFRQSPEFKQQYYQKKKEKRCKKEAAFHKAKLMLCRVNM